MLIALGKFRKKLIIREKLCEDIEGVGVKLQYLEKILSQDIDIEKLRPGKFYDFLIKKEMAT